MVLVELVMTFISLPITEVFIAFVSELKFTPFFKWWVVQRWYFTVVECSHEYLEITVVMASF